MLCRDARSSGLAVVSVPYLPHCLLIMDQPSAFAPGADVPRSLLIGRPHSEVSQT
jgi:hypothetical protein